MQVDGQALLFVLSNHFINEFIGFGFDFSNEEIAERYSGQRTPLSTGSLTL